jgi:pimeloyl-ACP methyl ester carboxylesterase
VFRSWYLLVLAAGLLASSAVVGASAAHSAPPPTVVVFVGGVGSTTASAAANFGPLVRELIVGQHAAVREFAYGGSSAAYTAERSCQPIAQSTAELVGFMRDLRDTHAADSAIVVGHSNGGVIALDLVATAPDLAPFVRRVVAVDSPVGGLSESETHLYGRFVGACSAIDELYARQVTPGWNDYVVQLVQWERSIGTDVAIVANPSDVAVNLDEQQVAGLEVNFSLNASDGSDWTNHGAVLHAAEVLPRLAAIVAAP